MVEYAFIYRPDLREQGREGRAVCRLKRGCKEGSSNGQRVSYITLGKSTNYFCDLNNSRGISQGMEGSLGGKVACMSVCKLDL